MTEHEHDDPGWDADCHQCHIEEADFFGLVDGCSDCQEEREQLVEMLRWKP